MLRIESWHNGSLGILDAAGNKAGSDELEDCSVVGQTGGMRQCGRSVPQQTTATVELSSVIALTVFSHD